MFIKNPFISSHNLNAVIDFELNYYNKRVYKKFFEKAFEVRVCFSCKIPKDNYVYQIFFFVCFVLGLSYEKE